MLPTSSIQRHAVYIDKKLQLRLRIYFVIAFILIIVMFVNMFRHQLGLVFGLVGLAAGLVIGVISSRMFHTSWDKDAAQVVSRLDIFGLVILAGYILIEVFRGQIIGYFTDGQQVTTTGLALLAGIMYGRLLGTRGQILAVLKQQQVFGQ